MKTSKQLVRTFIMDRAINRAPIPNQDEIRRQLGFGLVAQESTLEQFEHTQRMFALQLEKEAIQAAANIGAWYAS